MSPSPHATWREILTVARYAPSPHNVQPWRIRILSASEAELFIDGQRTLPKEDTTGSFLLSTMGIFLEAIDLLAAPKGFHLEYTLHRSPEWFAEQARSTNSATLIPFANLRLMDGVVAPSVYTELLFFKRRTCRISMHATPVPPDAAASLASLAQRWRHSYHQIDSPERIERIIDRNVDAVFHDLNLADYHDEIVSWFRFTDRSAQDRRDGLDRRCMNVSPSEFWLSARLPWVLQFPPTRAFLKARYRRQLGHIPALGLLSGKFFAAENTIDSGRLLMRFWLEATRLGLYLHPYGNMVTNPEAAAWLKSETGIDDVWLVFKIGYADEPPQSYRRSLDEILVS